MTTIARYKYGYTSDEWGMNRSLSLIADAAGDVCRFSDVEALQARVAELTARLSASDEIGTSMAARVAEIDAEKAVWIRRADKTWHEKHFTDQIEALQAQLTTEHLNCAMADEAVKKMAARVAELETACDLARTAANFLSAERDKLAAELAAARAQEPEVEAYDNCNSEKICSSWCGNSSCVSHYAAMAQKGAV